jgi:hypothetical protein
MFREKTIVLWLIYLALLGNSACQKNSGDFTSNSNSIPAAASDELIERAPPFATKEPEKYSAKIVFVSQLSADTANSLEQNTFVARDRKNRRIDFEIGENKISYLQIADDKQFVSIVKRKIYSELTGSNEKLFKNQPPEFSLDYLLYMKPIGATFERLDEEEVLGRQTTKYQLNYGTVKEAPQVRTETFVWADAKLGLPIKTEVLAIENGVPSGAKSTMELREINMEVDPAVFEIPKDFRKVSYQEIRQILQQK